MLFQCFIVGQNKLDILIKEEDIRFLNDNKTFIFFSVLLAYFILYCCLCDIVKKKEKFFHNEEKKNPYTRAFIH